MNKDFAILSHEQDICIITPHIVQWSWTKWGKKDFKSWNWWIPAKNCFTGTSGDLHIWTHISCKRMYKTTQAQDRQNSTMNRGIGHNVLFFAKEQLVIHSCSEMKTQVYWKMLSSKFNHIQKEGHTFKNTWAVLTEFEFHFDFFYFYRGHKLCMWRSRIDNREVVRRVNVTKTYCKKFSTNT